MNLRTFIILLLPLVACSSAQPKPTLAEHKAFSVPSPSVALTTPKQNY